MNIFRKNILAIMILVGLLFFIFNRFESFKSGQEMTFSDFLNAVDTGSVSEALIQGTNVYFKTSEGQFTTIIPDNYSSLPDTLFASKVRFRIEHPDESNIVLMFLGAWLPVLLIVGIIIFFSKQMQSGSKIMGFGKFNLSQKSPNQNPVTFDDVAGIDEAKEEVREIVDFLKEPQKFSRIGGRIPTGVLLTGSPGTGKTLLAKAIAGEAGVPFFSLSGSDFVEMFVGVGASRVRDLFQQAREKSPCIVFIDEIDAVGRNRGNGMGGGNDEREQTLNQLLVEMDGFSGHEGLIIIAATNRPDVLDPALLRPGRFDRQVVIPPPDLKGREKILGIHAAKITLAEEVDLNKIAASTVGFTGADLANLVNEAALLAGRAKLDVVTEEEFEKARDKIIMGAERKTFTMKENEKEATSYHEAGHAILGALNPLVDPVHKVTVIPRGRALGVTMFVPEKDKFYQTYNYLLQQLEVLMGGRAAEEIIYKHFTTGASNDLERSTDIAHHMVCSWGMNKELGTMYVANDDNQSVFLGREFMKSHLISQKLNEKIDNEVQKLVNKSYKNTIKKLKDNMDALHEIAKKLVAEETVDGNWVREVVAKYKKTNKSGRSSGSKGSATSSGTPDPAV